MAPWTADGDAQMTDAHGRNSRENQENDPNSQDQHDVIADRNRIRVVKMLRPWIVTIPCL